MAISITILHSFVYDEHDYLNPEEAAEFKRVLNAKTDTWHREVAARRMTCGSMVEVGGGAGSGKGSLFMSVFQIGPFIGH